MPHTITGVSGGAYVGSCTAPSAGDAVTAASVYNGEQAILDDATFLAETITRTAYSDAVRGFEGRYAQSTIVAVADGNKRLGVAPGGSINYAGRRFELASVPASPRVLTLDHSTVAPVEAEIIEAVWFATSFGGGTQYSFKREDATVIATFDGATGPEVTKMFCWAMFEYRGGVWRLARSSGFAVDTAPGLFGVVPGAGA